MANYFVYVLTNKPSGTLYVGVTNDLVRRVYEHREESIRGFTQRCGLKQLVYFEVYDDPTRVIQREKNIKHWPRVWKIELVQNSNPQWRDLYKRHHALKRLMDARVKPGHDRVALNA
jgi:putative endonuclease